MERVPGEERGAEAPAPADPVLLRQLSSAADAGGFLSFDRFMELALYDRSRGFYDRAEARLGRSGSFYTAPHVHELYGATLARHVSDLRRASRTQGPWKIVEVGAGDGTLALDVLSAVGRLGGTSAEWDYVLVEPSPALQAQARQRLESNAPAGLPWRFAPSLAAEGPIQGVVLANELLDAFPVRRLRRTAGGWEELGVRVVPDGLRWGSAVVPEEARPSNLPGKVPVGTVLEISPTTEAWIREVADHLTAGRAVLIDYGDDEEALVERSPSGTLQALRDHRPVDPLDRPGTSDLSAWVNFTRVRRTAAAAGLQETSYRPMAEALVRWGIDGVRTDLAAGRETVAAVQAQLAQKSFLFAFSTFRVLELEPSAAHAAGGEKRS